MFYSFIERVMERMTKWHQSQVQQPELSYLSQRYLDGYTSHEAARALRARRGRQS